MTRRWLLPVLLVVYAMGPAPSFGGLQLGDVLLLMLAMATLALSRVRANRWVLLFFAWPALVVLIAMAGRVFLGYAADRDSINNVLRTGSLGLLGILAAMSGRDEALAGRAEVDRVYLRVIAVAVAFNASLGLAQYAFPGSFGVVRSIYEIQTRSGLTNLESATEFGRITSVFSWANAFGEFLVFGLTVLVVNARRVGTLPVAAALVLGVPALLLTNSREAMTLALLMLVMVAVAQRRWNLLLGAAVVVAAIAVFVPLELLIGARNVARLGEIADWVRYGEVPVNVESRLLTLSYLPARIARSPFVYFGFPMRVYESTIWVPWDNQYLGFLVKYGAVGVLLIGWQVASLLLPWRLWIRLRGHATLAPALQTLVILAVLGLVGGMSGDTLFVERWQEFYFAYTGIVLGAALASLPVAPPAGSLPAGREVGTG